MGGGTAMRGLSRVIGRGGGSTGGCSGIGSSRTSLEKIKLSSSAPAFTMIDDWEFAEDEDGFQTHQHTLLDQNPHVRDRIIFGSVPTHQEVMEATSELQDVLKKKITSVSSTLGHESLSSSILSVHDNADLLEVSNVQETEGKFHKSLPSWVEPELDQGNDRVVQKSGHSNVLEAFNLLQSNPAIQGMVISLASDKAVWDALLKNEKVQEFRQALLKGESVVSETNKDADMPSLDLKNPFVEVIENMKAKLMEYMEKITELCGQFFGFPEKKFVEKNGDFFEKALEASSMLCIAVLLIVLVKRA